MMQPCWSRYVSKAKFVETGYSFGSISSRYALQTVLILALRDSLTRSQRESRKVFSLFQESSGYLQNESSLLPEVLFE